MVCVRGRRYYPPIGGTSCLARSGSSQYLLPTSYSDGAEGAWQIRGGRRSILKGDHTVRKDTT